MRKYFLFLSFLISVSSTFSQVGNPYYLVAKKENITGTNRIRLSWKADQRDLTVRNLVTVNGSSTMAGQGVSGPNSFDSSVIGRTMKYLDNLQPGAMTWFTFALGGQSARNWPDEGPYVDPVRNINYAIYYQYNNSGFKEYPKIMIVQDASNFVVDGTTNLQNRAYLKNIVTKGVQAGAQVFLISNQPRTGYTTPQKQQLEDFYFDLLNDYVTNKVKNVRLVQVYDTLVQQPSKDIVTAFYFGDGIHLNNTGHNVIYTRLKRAIDSVYMPRPDILRHEIQYADAVTGPWINYNNNVHRDTGFVNLPMTFRTKFFRVKTVYTNSTETEWSNITNPIEQKIMPFEYIDADMLSKDRMGSGFHQKYWWDGFATHDPKNNGLLFTDSIGQSTAPFATRFIHHPKGFSEANGMPFYAGDRPFRLIYDLDGDKDIFKLHKFRITDIYGMQSGGDYGDTLKFYNFDYIMKLPVDQRPLYIARFDSLMQPFAKLVQGNAIVYRSEWNGVNLGMTDSMRWVLVKVTKKFRAVGWESMPTFSELVIYGEKLYSSDTVDYKQFNYTGPLPKRVRAGKALGVNNVGVELSQLQYDAASREYISAGSFDSDTAAYPLNKYNLNPFNFSIAYWEDNFGDAKRQGRLWWETARAGSKRLEKYGAGNVAKSLAVTEPFMEPESPYSYARIADLAYHYSAVFGNNPNHTDAEFPRLINKSQLPGYGIGYRSAYEPGNEDESRGSTMFAMIVKDNVIKDGWEGRIPNVGMKLGDSTMKLIQPASIGMDTGMIKTTIFFNKIIRSDKKIIYDYFNVHEYPRKWVNPAVTEHDPTYDEQVGARAATPEEYRIGEEVDLVERVLFRELNGDTTKRLILSEYGMENFATPPSSVADITYGPPYFAFWSTATVPKVAGRDSLQGKGMLMARTELRFLLTRMPFFNEYMIANDNYDPDNNFPGMFARSGRGAANGVLRNTLIPTKFAHYWSRASLYTAIQNYVGDSILAYDSIGLCLLKFRNYQYPDSVMYAVWKGSWNGSTMSSVAINVGVVAGNSTRTSLSFTNPIGASSLQAVSSGQIFIPTLTEEPKFYFVKESLPASLNYIPKRKGHGLWFNY